MATEVKMPQMGESIAEGTLTRWFKKPGDPIQRDEPLFEISTDKVDAEIPAPSDGVLERILVEEGTTVEVNTTVAILAEAGENGAGSAEVALEAAGAGEASPPRSDAEAPSGTATHAAPAAEAAAAGISSRVRSSPLVRRIAREHGISDLSPIPGSGANGRVTKEDILAYIESGAAAVAARAAAGARTPAPTSAVPSSGPHEVLPLLNLPREGVSIEPMTIMRRKIAEHMVHSRRVSAHVHSVFEADMTRIVGFREGAKEEFQRRHGVKLSYMPFFVKAAVSTLLEFPHVNASLDGDSIVLHNAVHVGIAVALDGGLIVPVVKDAHELNLVGIQKRVTDLAHRARTKALLPDDVQGGTFTITNPGQYGGLFGIPIINQPQVAILGVGGMQKRPVVVEGDAIAVRTMVYLCLSYDHRLVDGALADQFMARLKVNLEEWDDISLG